MAWLVTFLGVIFLDVDLGLYVGISISIFVILIRLVRYGHYHQFEGTSVG